LKNLAGIAPASGCGGFQIFSYFVSGYGNCRNVQNIPSPPVEESLNALSRCRPRRSFEKIKDIIVEDCIAETAIVLIPGNCAGQGESQLRVWSIVK